MVIHHAVLFDPLPDGAGRVVVALHTLLDYGHLGVPMFFVISGFCIHLQWARGHAMDSSYKLDFFAFWRRRIGRLYPPYFFALCLSMGLVVAAYLAGSSVPLVTQYPEPRPQWMAMDFFAHLTMLHGLHPVFDKAGGNGVFWTLAREEYFYLMYFPLLAWRLRYGAVRSVAFVLALGVAFPLVVGALLPAGSPWWSVVSTSAIALWIQWVLGMIAAEEYCGLRRLPRWTRQWLLVPVWAALAILSEGSFGVVSPVFWGLAFFTVLNSAVARERAGRWPTAFPARWLAGVGLFSYSLYLVHNPIRAVGKQLLRPIIPTDGIAGFALTAALLAIAGYYAGKVFFVLVERHFLAAKPRAAPARPGVAIPAPALKV